MKYILILLIAFVFTACDEYAADCKERGYKGIVLANHPLASNGCSDGALSPDEGYYMTRNGLKSVSSHMYMEFPKDSE